MPTVRRLIATARRALADYSLRKFLVYAANPFRWAGLASMRQVRQGEISAFSRMLSEFEVASSRPAEPCCLTFRPWLNPAMGLPLGVMQEGPTDLSSCDPEIRMRVDRLGWAIERVGCVGATIWEAVADWWSSRDARGLAYADSYTLSERVCNLILLWNLHEPPEKLKNNLIHLLSAAAFRLVAHPEYHGEDATNNHILNNARALILYGDFIDEPNYIAAGLRIFDHQFHRHVSSDGLVREASTHYQWVITRWVVEVGLVLRQRDEQAFGKLALQLAGMLDVCDCMCLGNASRAYLPLLGDISPDFSPEFYGGLTAFGRRVIAGTAVENVSAASGGLSGFWSSHFPGFGHRQQGDWLARDGSWARLERGPWSLITHADTHPDDNRASHGHHDLFSFELAYEGRPLIVDPGRGNYLTARDSEEAGILEEWHNTLMLNGYRTGFIPRGYMPVEWLRSFRLRPELVLNESGLTIRVLAFPKRKDLQEITRSFAITTSGALRVTSFVSLTRNASISMILYVLGECSHADDGLLVHTDDGEFMIRWRGLDEVRCRPARQYIAYDTSRQCTRIEWSARAAAPHWEAEFEFARRDKSI